MSVDERLASLSARIEAAARAAGRDPTTVHLVAVSKRHPASAVIEAADAGQLVFGENFAQEMMAKQDEVGRPELSWHFIGKLQRNKAKQVVGRAALIHAVDSSRLVDEIGKRAVAAGVEQAILIAVNLAGEASKSGVAAGQCAALVDHARATAGVDCRGLMTMPPLTDDPERVRPHFRRLRELASELGLPELSMGTTGDFEVAIAEGATLIRVGTAVFGPRPQP
ncbi:MAG: YggS family pyridoxal phosphate-dependent enzyme [Deltaproteobacteria bacterium]|jgi:pyridoxal phosphate enzyme (YggS family)|nr:YggS family pyridoxal phosphate-dependent enzyme [Deltaproteobacteria bacterium]